MEGLNLPNQPHGAQHAYPNPSRIQFIPTLTNLRRFGIRVMVVMEPFAERQESENPPISTRLTGSVDVIPFFTVFVCGIPHEPVTQ